MVARAVGGGVLSNDRDQRLDALASLVLRLAGGEYSARGHPTPARDEIDALTVGLNMLAETLQMERRAREVAEGLLRDSVHAYEHAPAMFCSVDFGSLRLVKCNATFADTLGLPKDGLLDRCLLDFLAAEERPGLADTLEAVGETPSMGDSVLIGADGRSRPVLFSASAVSDVGRVDRIRIILRDISAERSLEEQLRQAQKMEAVGRLASGVAHDFNNMLTVVLGAVERLHVTLDDAHPGREQTELIHDATMGAAGLTRQLLALGRSDLATPGVYDLNTMIIDSKALLERTLGEQIVLELDLHPESLPLQIDPTHLTQVLLNLTLNARDAMPEGGSLRLRTETEHAEAGIVRIVLSATDTGIGMAENVLQHAIEPFFTTKEVSKGSGLGLAVCYGIARQAGGTLELSSRPGQGTTIRVRLPLADRAVSLSREPVPFIDLAGSGERLLVVDDSEGVRDLMDVALSSAGYEVTPAGDGDEALAAFLEGPAFELLVTDVVMPGMDGPELAQTLWRDNPDLAVIFVSGYAGDRLDESLLERPGVRFLRKPFRASMLANLAHELLVASDTQTPV